MEIISSTFVGNIDNINSYIEDIDYLAVAEGVYTEHHLSLTEKYLVINTTYNSGKDFKCRKDNRNTF